MQDGGWVSGKEPLKEYFSEGKSWACAHVLCGCWEGEKIEGQGNGQSINCFPPIFVT